MRSRPGILWRGLLIAAALLPDAQADPTLRSQAEIEYLLAFVGASHCEFNRNGVWYAPQRAQAHLRSKYEYLVAHDRLATAEQFIELAATKSSLSGRPYLLKCSDDHIVTSESWLRSALANYRSSHPP